MIWERRADMVSALGAAFVLGWVSCGGYYSIGHLWQAKNKLVNVETTVVPALQTQVKQTHCDNQKLAQVAAQGIAAGEDDNVAAPEWEDLAACPTVAAVKAPPLSKIIPK